MKILSLAFWQGMLLKYGVYGLALNAFLEAIIFPLPPDVLLIALSLSNPAKAYLYAAVATFFSVSGGVIGYYVGYVGGKPLAFRLFGEEKVNKFHRLYEQYESIIILTAGFTPLPYKVFTISSGVLYASLFKLVLFSLIGRGARFFIEAFFIKKFGKAAVGAFLSHINSISLAVGAFLVISYLIYRRIKRGKLP